MAGESGRPSPGLGTRGGGAPVRNDGRPVFKHMSVPHDGEYLQQGVAYESVATYGSARIGDKVDFACASEEE